MLVGPPPRRHPTWFIFASGGHGAPLPRVKYWPATTKCGRNHMTLRLPLPRRRFLQLAGAAAFPAAPRPTFALDYPTRPIRWIIGYPAGGSADTTSRIMAQWLHERLGQPVIIENKP